MSGPSILSIKLKSTSNATEKIVEFPLIVNESGLSTSPTVEDLLRKVQEVFEVPQHKNIRLIYAGKLLSPPTATLTSFHLQSGAYVHVAVSDRVQITSNRINNVRQPMHIPRGSLGGLDVLLSDEIDESQSNPLLRPGYRLSVDEVAALRSSFRPSIDSFIQEHSITPNPQEDEISYRLRVEAMWLQAQTSSSEFMSNLPRNNRSSSNLPTGLLVGDSDADVTAADPTTRDELLGTYNDYFWGFAMGYFLGILAVFCVWDRHISRRQKLGMIFGLLFQMFTLENNDPKNRNSNNSHQLRGNGSNNQAAPAAATPSPP